MARRIQSFKCALLSLWDNQIKRLDQFQIPILFIQTQPEGREEAKYVLIVDKQPQRKLASAFSHKLGHERTIAVHLKRERKAKVVSQCSVQRCHFHHKCSIAPFSAFSIRK
ncbi:CLUMA_CG017494, isoform A [Clunio marinus]|uniref:CLUMA_CG017494, isoform A n=1 Tax=Clunio marinus TaxID=568069 RepID=A0A1J1IWC5_9DIPT|nr:CLUMA_CG017494, isoform A [Clunio marinus]